MLKVRYSERVWLCYTDTNSLLVQIQTDNINANLIDMADQFDFSDYPVWSFEWIILAKPHSACQNYDVLSRDVTQNS